jgi:hypothetical protein
MLRRRRPPEDPLAAVTPAGVSPRFAGAVAAALDVRAGYTDLLSGMRPGPSRDRLATLQSRVDAGVLAVWDTARRAGDIERTLATLGPDRVTAEYKQARRTAGDDNLEAALAQRFASVQRLLNTLDDTDERLRLLDARLGAAVASAAEVAVGTAPPDAVGEELESVVSDLEALRAALHDLA